MARQGKCYTKGCLLDYDFIKYHDRLIAFDLSRQKELDADPKATHKIEFVEQLTNLDDDDDDDDNDDDYPTDAGHDQNIFVLKILEKIKKHH